jgi:hypothetical protein
LRQRWALNRQFKIRQGDVTTVMSASDKVSQSRMVGPQGDIAFAHELVDGFVPRSATSATTLIICDQIAATGERSSSRPSETARSSEPTTPISIRSAKSSNQRIQKVVR